MNLSNFFYENFMKGWSNPEAYNAFDTLAYAFLAIILISLTYKALKGKAKFDSKLLLSVLLFIILGSLIRVYADYGVYERFFWTVTPGIWILMLLLFIICFFLDKLLQKRLFLNYIPIVLIFFHLLDFELINPEAILLYAAAFAAFSAPFIIFRKKIPILKDNLSLFALLSHFFDAASTFVNVDFYNYVEVHVVGSYFTTLLQTGFAMYPLKLIVLLPLLYYINKDEDKDFGNYLKIMICVLGLGPGIRNFVSILMGV